MIKNERIGLVTVTYNSGDVLEDFLTSCWLQDYSNFHLYIIDNASSDSTIEQLNKIKDPRVTLILNTKNLGVAEANNQGIKAGLADGCQSILLINNDTTFPEDLITKLNEGACKYNAEIVAPTMYYFDEPEKIWFGGGRFIKWRALQAAHEGYRVIDTKNRYSLDKRITYAPTCCTLIHKNVFEKIGYMDERYFVYYDDTDFFFRTWQADIVFYYLGTTKLYHKVSSLTGGHASRFTLKYMTRNRVIFLRKHTSSTMYLYSLVFMQIEFLYCLFKGINSLSDYFYRQKCWIDGLKFKL